jgi:hypothetical protein
MDFLTHVNDLVEDSSHKSLGIKWWDDLTEDCIAGARYSSACEALRLNVVNSQLVDLAPALKDLLSAFCGSLLERVTAGDSVSRAASAFNGAVALLCCGPQAASLSSTICTLVSFETFVDHWAALGRYSRTAKRRMWNDLGDRGRYIDYVHPRKFARGALPLRFWTSEEDIAIIDGTSAVSVNRLAKYLGLKWFAPSLLVAIRDGKEPESWIPTGWDGFDNPNFRETDSYDASNPTTHYGYTLDLETGTPGPREIVTKPVVLEDTRLVKKYE